MSAADQLNAVESYLPAGFVDREQLSSISAIASTLPSPSAIGFEAHLGSIPLQVDFAACFVSDGTPGYEILCGTHPSLDLSRNLIANPVWKRIRRFLLACRDSASPLHEISHNLWLEFDVASHASPVPIPNVLFGLSVVPDSLPAVKAALEILLDHPLPSPTTNSLAACFRYAPPQAHVFQIGVMPSRGWDAVRVCVHGLSTTEILSYLDAVHWAGDRGQIEAVLSSVSPLVQTIAVDLDVAQLVSPRLGLECFVLDHRVPEAPPEWRRFLAHLTAVGLCTPSQSDSLLEWPGYHSQRFVLLPTVFVRGLSHVKLVCGTGRPVKAKAYFGFIHSWAGRMQGPLYTTEALFGCPPHGSPPARPHP